MANTWINPTAVARRTIAELENNCMMGNNVYRGYEDDFKQKFNGWKVGNSITIKSPVYFRVKDGATIDVVDLREEDTTFTLAYRKHVAYKVTSEEMTYSIDKFQERFIKPAAVALGNFIDKTTLGLYNQIPAQYGTPGTTPSDFYTFAQAGAYLSDMAVPVQDRKLFMDPWAQAKLADHLKGVFNSPMVNNSIQYGRISENFAGFEAFMSQNVNTHTCGSDAGGTIKIDAAGSEGDVLLNLDNGSGADVNLAAGDILDVDTVNGVNPISGDSLGYKRQFVVTEDMTGGTASTIPGVAPWQIYSASATEKNLPYQTVDALPANNDTVTSAGSSSLQHKANLAFHKDALGLCMVPLEMPASVAWGSRQSYKGYSIRVVRDYDVVNDVEYCRWDVLFGIKVLNPFMAARVAGQ